MTPVPLMTADELLLYQPDDKQTELIRGRMVVREPPSAMHGQYAAFLAYLLMQHVLPRRAGRVFVEAGFHIQSNPDTVLGPDVAFVDAARVAEIPPTGFAPLTPDLVVEVMSPGDRMPEVLTKVGRWLDAGVCLVWVINPMHRVAQVYREHGMISVLEETDALDGEDVLPGFSCPLRRVLDLV